MYHKQELKHELIRAGYVFETTTDTEVILYGYMHGGADFVNHLNGIFAFAIWDGVLERLLLYRDRVGVKPLFYTRKGQSLVFGSELKALFRHPDVQPALSLDSFREVFGLGPARTPGCGVFRDIQEILPGHYAVFSRDGLRDTRYWELEAKEHTDSYQETVETVSWLVRDAIRRQMVSDVPVCTFLSGGIDFSIITAVASDYMNRNGTQLNTFSFDFKINARGFRSHEVDCGSLLSYFRFKTRGIK